MLGLIWACIYFFIPAYLANAMPPLLKNVKYLDCPIDNNKTINGRPILGDHKTWRGAVAILITGTVVNLITFYLHWYFNWSLYSIIGLDYLNINWWMFGLLMSLGVLLGDLSFAFIKRRVCLKPGSAFIPFDQINYVLGTFIVLQPMLNLNLKIWLILLIATFFIHVIFNRVGYEMGLHQAKW